jgi:hypothetical protein
VSGLAGVSARSRGAALREAAVVGGLGLGAIWLISAQTKSGAVLGLSPAFLPTVCAVAIVALTAIGLGIRLWRPEPLRPERVAHWWPAALVLGVAIAGVLALQLAGPLASGLTTVTLGLAAMRERRVAVLSTTLAVTALVLILIFHVWR